MVTSSKLKQCTPDSDHPLSWGRLRHTKRKQDKLYALIKRSAAEVAGVTFSDSPPVPKLWNPGPAIFQIWESDSCSDSGYNHQSNLNLPMFLLNKWPHRLRYCRNWKVIPDPGPFFPKFLTPDPGPKEKRRILPESTPDPVPPLVCGRDERTVIFCDTDPVRHFLNSVPVQPQSKTFQKFSKSK